MSWETETCETCQFRVNAFCRVEPPDHGPVYRSAYRVVSVMDGQASPVIGEPGATWPWYQLACAQYVARDDGSTVGASAGVG